MLPPTHPTRVIWHPETFLFHLLKSRHFDTLEVLEAELQAVLNTHRTQLPGCIKKWQKHWVWCIRVEGDYFEGDGGQQAQS
jgi:hypothetical protein